jgi:hypothetical protein
MLGRRNRARLALAKIVKCGQLDRVRRWHSANSGRTDSLEQVAVLSAFSAAKARRITSGSLVEDEITSIVFGPLKYMAACDVWNIARELHFWEGHLAAEVVSLEVLFWPRYSNPESDGHWRSCEPDVVFVFKFESTTDAIVALEIKWNASASSTDPEGNSDQLARQWTAIGNASKAVVEQVYLTKSALEARSGVEGTCARPMTWSEFRRLLSNLKKSNHQVSSWAADVSAFLSKLNVVPFGGFIGLHAPPTVEPFELRHAELKWPDASSARKVWGRISDE